MNQKICDRDTLAEKVRLLKKEGTRVVFTNGCFDILHVGHVRYLAAAKAEGDCLIVGLNSDRSVRTIKGERRPVVPEQERAEVLAALSVVDYVTLFDELDPLVTIQMLLPQVLVKGADWEKDAIIGADVVEKAGGQVVRIPLAPGASTTGIIEKIVSTYSDTGSDK